MPERQRDESPLLSPGPLLAGGFTGEEALPCRYGKDLGVVKHDPRKLRVAESAAACQIGVAWHKTVVGGCPVRMTLHESKDLYQGEVQKNEIRVKRT